MTHSFDKRWVAAVLVVAATLASGQLSAAGGANDEEVENLGAEGIQAYQAGRNEEARVKLRRAFALSHYPTVGVWLAKSLEGLGRAAEAFDVYQSVELSPLPPGAPDLFRQAQTTAHNERLRLSKQVALLQLSGSQPSDSVMLQVNGEPRDYPANGVLAVPPGQVVLTADVAGKRSVQTLQVATGETLPVSLSTSTVATPPSGQAPGAAVASGPAPAPAESAAAPSTTPPPASASAPSGGSFEAGAQLGLELPYGSAFSGVDLSKFSSLDYVLALEAGYRINPAWLIGGYLGFGFGGLTSDAEKACKALGRDCSISHFRLGLQGRHHFAPENEGGVWLGAGLGYESLTSNEEAGPNSLSFRASGFELRGEGGYDLRFGRFRFGPIGALTLGRFISDYKGTCSGPDCEGETAVTADPDDAFHGWFYLGARATISLGGS
jgi:Autotransporter beta-domain